MRSCAGSARPAELAAGAECSTVSLMSSQRELREAYASGGARGLVSTLKAPESGLVGQGVRFALSGGIAAFVYLGSTTVLAEVVGLPFEAALAIGFSLGVVVSFTLQRAFVWLHHEEFALPLAHQLGRYLLAAAAQYGITATATGLLPAPLGVSAESVYLVTVAVVVSSNFLVLRYGIFHAKRVDSRSDEVEAGEAPSVP
jgi:putative flippase GtrA